MLRVSRNLHQHLEAAPLCLVVAAAAPAAHVAAPVAHLTNNGPTLSFKPVHFRCWVWNKFLNWVRVKQWKKEQASRCCTVIGARMSHRKWREIKQHLIWWPDLSLPGCCLISLHFQCNILAPITVQLMFACVSLWISCTTTKKWPNLFFFPLLE